jgi:hypothetical protein
MAPGLIVVNFKQVLRVTLEVNRGQLLLPLGFLVWLFVE